MCGSHCSNPVGWGTGGVSRGSNLDRGLRLRYNYNMDSNPAAHYQETVMKVRKHIRIKTTKDAQRPYYFLVKEIVKNCDKYNSLPYELRREFYLGNFKVLLT